ncbi:MAG TPA: BMP family ABC transporter substrate-binding protein [Synergistales bacterium]|nr:BMP family ABC transporter substrate-binding protein [Synergistales bacterium]
MRRGLGFAFVMAFLLAATTAWAFAPVPAKDLKPGFVYVGPVGDGGWTYMHDKGRKDMEKALPGVTSSIVESVPEGPDAVRVMETFVRNGSKLIFATSFGYMDYVQEVAKKHPDVVFMHCSGYKTAPNVGTYFGRIYQPRYLSGLVAGKMTKSNIIGYVAANPIPEVIRGINAFTLGVRKVNPKAKVKVVWLFSWFDPGKEKEATKALIDSGADVIAMHADSGAAPQAAEEAKVWVVGYNNDMSRYAPTRHLTAPIWNWGMLYKYAAENVIKGTWKSESIWWGLKENMVGLAPFGKAVPESVRKLVAEEKGKIVSGKWDVFTGPIKDQSGKIRVEAGKRMSDPEMLSFNWFVQGVEGTIPK